MATAPEAPKIWCDEDGHRKYEDFADFNEWFDSPEGAELRVQALVEGLANPSKAFFAGDREAYIATLEGFRLDRRNEWLFEAIKIKARADSADLPQHFSIEQCPGDEAALIARNEYLLRIGVTPIWFPAGEFDFVEGILKLARNELRFRRD